MIPHEAVQTKPTDSYKPSQVSVTRNTFPEDKAFHPRANLANTYTQLLRDRAVKGCSRQAGKAWGHLALSVSWARVDLHIYTVANGPHQVSSPGALERSKGFSPGKQATVASWRETTWEGRGSVMVARQEGQYTIISGKKKKMYSFDSKGLLDCAFL